MDYLTGTLNEELCGGEEAERRAVQGLRLSRLGNSIWISHTLDWPCRFMCLTFCPFVMREELSRFSLHQFQFSPTSRDHPSQ
jgi:hypothetical protein